MANHQPVYYSYLIRLWQVEEDGKPTWRASLDDPRSGERMGFASLEMLYLYLMEKIKREGIQPANGLKLVP